MSLVPDFTTIAFDAAETTPAPAALDAWRARATSATWPWSGGPGYSSLTSSCSRARGPGPLPRRPGGPAGPKVSAAVARGRVGTVRPSSGLGLAADGPVTRRAATALRQAPSSNPSQGPRVGVAAAVVRPRGLGVPVPYLVTHPDLPMVAASRSLG